MVARNVVVNHHAQVHSKPLKAVPIPDSRRRHMFCVPERKTRAVLNGGSCQNFPTLRLSPKPLPSSLPPSNISRNDTKSKVGKFSMVPPLHIVYNWFSNCFKLLPG